MPRNDHKKVLLELSQAYNQVQEGWEQKVGEAGRRIAGAFKRKKKEPESKEEKPAPKEKPKVSRSAGKYGTAIADPGWKGDVDPTDISAKRKSGKSYEDRKRWGVVTKADREQLQQDIQGEWGDKYKDYAKRMGAADTSKMDDYGYTDEDYALPTHDKYHPDNIERQDNPRHNYIRKKGISDKYKPSDTILDHEGKPITRSAHHARWGDRTPTKPESQHQRNESTITANHKLQYLVEAYNNVFNK
tara:strand:- start:68 stop:802 length:735 start_codon:yes stop_codon:yes gene_type:complete